MLGKARCPKCGTRARESEVVCPRCRALLRSQPAQAPVELPGVREVGAWLGPSGLLLSLGGPQLRTEVKSALLRCLKVWGAGIALMVMAHLGRFASPQAKDLGALGGVLWALTIAGNGLVFYAVFSALWTVGKAFLPLVRSDVVPNWANHIYGEFAQRVGGELTQMKVRVLGRSWNWPEAVTSTHDGAHVRLDIEGWEADKTPYPLVTSADKIPYTRVTFDLPQPTRFRCHVYPQGAMARLGTALGIQDVQLGSQPFDDQFVVKTNDEAMARSVLVAEAQEELLNLRQWARERPGHPTDTYPDYVELIVEETTLRVRVVGVMMTTEELVQLYETSGRIYDKISKAL